MKLTTNPLTILLRPCDSINEVQLDSGIVLKSNQTKNTKQLSVIAIGNKISDRLGLTTKSKVIISGGIPVTIEDIEYVVAKEDQILCVLNP